MFYWFSFYLVKFLSAIFSPRIIIGAENLPKDTAYILASNHLSNIDPFLIGLCTGRRTSYMAKDSLFTNPILRVMLKGVEAFPVRRGTADVWALREAMRRLKKGLPVVMFPEGTRKTAQSQGKVQSGIGFIAQKANIPIVPVKILNSDKVLPPGKSLPKRHPVTISFGEPLTFDKSASYEEVVANVMKAINQLPDQ